MEDERCCGSGTCIINAEGYCWCGQRWNGTCMVFPAVKNEKAVENDASQNTEGRKID
jgi:hypothetical protein